MFRKGPDLGGNRNIGFPRIALHGLNVQEGSRLRREQKLVMVYLFYFLKFRKGSRLRREQKLLDESTQ